MNLEEAVWYVAAAYAVVLVALLLLFALLARRLVRLTQRVNALRGDAGRGDEPPSGADEALPNDGEPAPNDEKPAPDPRAATASAGRDVIAGRRESHDDLPPGEV